ncbi:MAG: nodulation protein NfeD [Candidatus Dormibacteria bacterium]
MARALRVVLAAVLLAAGILSGATPATATQPRVTQLRIDGVINVFTADYIVNGLDAARRDGAELVVIGMDTPGGIDSSMRRIIQAILASPLPVAVYVGPSGARAASAGLYITQAADIVAMAPGTNIGSAHPVFISAGGAAGGSGSSVEDQKVLNDSVAYIQGLATLHHRNVEWATDAVKNSVNVPAEQAVTLHVADRLSRDLPTLLRDIDGQQVSKHERSITVHSASALVEVRDMGYGQGVLHALADPQVAYLFLLLAILAIGFEITHPGAVLPGVIGVIAAALALVAFESLPVNLAGVALVLFALVLFAVDIHAPSHGVLTGGGVLSLALGSFLVLDAGAPFLEPNLWLAVLPPLAVGLMLAFLVSRAIAARRRPIAVGASTLLGVEGEARGDVGPGGGLVMVDGALWQASAPVTLGPGTRVRVRAVDGLRLTVERA